MRQTILRLSLVAAILLAGCDGGVDADLKKPAQDVRTAAASMSAPELEKRIKELEKRSDELQKKVGTKEPSEDQMKEMTKLVEVAGIYATELAKKKLK